jgi:type IV pilus assembly protein PilN
MIKINLAKKGTVSPEAAAQMVTVDSGDLSALRKTAIMRVLVMAIGPVALLLYEQQVIPELRAKVQQKSNEYNALVEKNNKAQEAVVQTKKFKKEQDILQTQINTIENLKKDRLREVKVLDFVQKDIPEHLWLTRMELLEGKLNIQGMATTDNELTVFMENLSRSAYLKEVSLIRSTDYLSPDYGALKKFEISCAMEKVQ